MKAPTGPGRPLRLRHHDYASCGEYFVTTVTLDRAELFGTVVDDVVRLSPAGEAVRRSWVALPSRFPFLRLDDFVVMPNHVHGILRFIPPEEMDPEAAGREAGRLHLDVVVKVFKSTAAMEVNRVLGRFRGPVWQPGCFEHVVRNDRALERIRDYIGRNPEAWPTDRYHPGGETGRRPPSAQGANPMAGG